MNLNQNWTPPDGLRYSSTRPVRLTGHGIFLAIVAAFMIVGALALGIFLSRSVHREAEAQRLLAGQGVPVEAVITRHWRTGGKSDEPRVAYRFQYQDSIYTNSVRAPLSQWKSLSVGSPLQVRIVPSKPAISHPVAWDAHVLPAWFPYLMAGLVASSAPLLMLVLARQIRLLAEGRPAPGHITGVRKSDKDRAVLYEFKTPDGATVKGRGRAFQIPPDAVSLCVLYDPENPRRNALYPLPLVRLGLL